MTGDTFSDAHVHLFTGSDLPIAGYTRYVFLPEVLGDSSDLFAVFTDIVLTVVKPFSPSIRKERRKLGLSPKTCGDRFSFRDVMSNNKIAQKITTHINTRLLTIAKHNPSLMLVDTEAKIQNIEDLSYIRLAFLLSTMPFQNSELNFKKNSLLADAISQDILVKSNIIRGLLTGSYDFKTKNFEIKDEKLDSIMSIQEVSALNLMEVFVWIGKMFQYRSRHLSDYQKEVKSQHLKPSKIINLLVDYDAWLRNSSDVNESHRPARGSSHSEQIKFWHDLKHKTKKDINIMTFAGYDPLKHAWEMRDQGTSEYFETLKTFAKSKTLQGFKLYPPMGFRSFGNSALNRPNNEDFIGSDGIKDSVVKWWGITPQIGQALDDALREFYRFTSDNDIPLMIHTKLSNYTARNFIRRASPEHIITATAPDAFPSLRICLGHFTEAQALINAYPSQNCDSPLDIDKPPAVKYSSRLFTPATPNIYADIGHMHDLLGKSEAYVTSFFSALLNYCAKYSEAENRLMFGSDWIMLAKEKDYKTYLSIVENGLDKALIARRNNDFSDFPDKFFRRNFDRYMKIEAI